MIKYGGFLFRVDEARRAEWMEEYIQRESTFTDTLSAPDWNAKDAELFFIAFDLENIHYAALARRGHRVATQKYQIRFLRFVKFEPPIPIVQIESRLTPEIRRHFIRSTSGNGSRVPPATWQNLLSVIKQLRPNSAPDLDKLETLRQSGQELIQKQGFEIVAHERDAVNIALRMSGFDHIRILDWSPPEGELAPFLKGLPSTALREDQIINHDAQVFGDWIRVRGYQVGATVFEHGAERLTVINVNRHKLEETLGVDLLYYFHTYESYIMVQYKRMIEQDGKLGYRPSNDSYQSELQRMHEFERDFHIEEARTTLLGYRLHSGVFYFKLCPAEVFELTSSEMIHGMYIPLDYWDILVNSPTATGPRGGKLVTYDNVGRYFNNSFFIDLARAGWVGSKVINSTVLTKIIQDSLQSRRSVILASRQPAG